MAEIINMPRLSDTMEEGVVAKWLKKVGDTIEEGEILAEIETDKATMEFESFHQGVLLHIGIHEGETAPVDALLAIIGDEGEDISALLSGGEAPAEEAPAPAAEVEVAAAPAQEVQIPEGVSIITMPRLSDTMEEGTVASWLKKVGDQVEEGDILAEIETDKATMEFESFYSGELLHIGIGEGDSAPVDEVLAIIGPSGTDVNAVLNAGVQAPSVSQPQHSTVEQVAEVVTTASPSVEESPAPSTNSDQRTFASPLAKKMASDMGFDLGAIKGSGENGRIIKRDVLAHKPAAASASATVAAAPALVQTAVAPVSGTVNSEGVKNSQMRKVIAKRLSESKFSAPHYYLTVSIEMDQAKAARAQMNQMPDTKVSFNDMVLKACAMALVKHPQVNTTWDNDQTIYHSHVNLGVAVAVDDGLVVPVIQHANTLGFTAIGAQVKDMAVRARDKKLTPAEMEGSTFTVSNLGMFGIEEFTSIINQPNSAILSVGAIVEKAVVREGEIVIRNMMKITLACDHRTVDGATGAQFLQTLKNYLEHPANMLA
jgi:pyruvate dehydrogenase E2 component (dihydrolipoamide acetyltransferase)